ncbi:unnamed protein product [Lasius platythorax]|uniref:Uncharacterized protein n=2 Tax=Lasius platythorax TaxID=488582 RepID=A0AAV2MZD7_9HYME
MIRMRMSDVVVIFIDDSDEEEQLDNNIIEVLEDSDYGSDSDDECVEETHRELGRAEIVSMDQLKKMCIIYFYYETHDYFKFCTTCFFGMVDSLLRARARAVRRHETACFGMILGKYCNQCR